MRDRSEWQTPDTVFADRAVPIEASTRAKGAEIVQGVHDCCTGVSRRPQARGAEQRKRVVKVHDIGFELFDRGACPRVSVDRPDDACRQRRPARQRPRCNVVAVRLEPVNRAAVGGKQGPLVDGDCVFPTGICVRRAKLTT